MIFAAQLLCGACAMGLTVGAVACLTPPPAPALGQRREPVAASVYLTAAAILVALIVGVAP